MTTFDAPVEQASAAGSGRSATARFRTDKSPFEALKDTPTERVDMLAREVLDAVHETICKHKVSYDEYNALKAWLIQVGQDGEWPLFLEVWVEHVVEDVATAHRHGNKGTIEGPYYLPNAPDLGADGTTLPMRDGEQGRHPDGVARHHHLHRRPPCRLAARRHAQTAGQQFVGGVGQRLVIGQVHG
jgi:catechol 1,2-dioxygenase